MNTSKWVLLIAKEQNFICGVTELKMLIVYDCHKYTSYETAEHTPKSFIIKFSDMAHTFSNSSSAENPQHLEYIC